MNKIKLNDFFCKRYVNCENCLFQQKGCYILNNQLIKSKKEWLNKINVQKIKADKEFILNQIILYIFTMAKKKKTRANIIKDKIEKLCFAGEDTYIIDCLWLSIQYGEIHITRTLSNYIYEKYGNYIKFFTKSLYDHRNCPPDEILQRVLLSLTEKQYKSLIAFEGKNTSQFRTYLTKIIWRKKSDCLKKFDSTVLIEDIENQPESDEIQNSPDNTFVNQEVITILGDIVTRAIEKIPSKKIIDIKIILWRTQGLSHKAIANKLGIDKENTVSRRYNRAKDRLITYIKQELRTVYQTNLNDIDPDEIYLSIEHILQNKIKQELKNQCTNIQKRNKQKVPDKFQIESLLKQMESESL